MATFFETAELSLAGLWGKRVTMRDAQGIDRVGFAAGREVTGAPRYAGEAGSYTNAAIDEPLWCFQAGDGIAGVVHTLCEAHRVLKRPQYLAQAKALGETLLYVQHELGSGWFFQDGAIIGGRYQNAAIWGAATGSRRRADAELQGIGTADDLTTFACVEALYRLFLETNEIRFLRGALMAFEAMDQLYRSEPAYRGAVPQILPIDLARRTKMNQAQDIRNPDGLGYPSAGTLNDLVHTGAMIMAIRMQRDLPAALSTMPMLLTKRLLAYQIHSHTGLFAQAYDVMTNRGRAARHNEPGWADGCEVMVTCETGVIPALALAAERIPMELTRMQCRLAIETYCRALQSLPRPTPKTPTEPPMVWRYYIQHPRKGWQPVFAKDYQVWVGAEFEGNASGGQPWRGTFDLHHANILMRDGRISDAELKAYAAEARVINVLPSARAAADMESMRSDGLWDSASNTIETRAQCGRILGFLRQVELGKA